MSDARPIDVRLRALAQTWRSVSGDSGKLFDDAANRICDLEAENERYRATIFAISKALKEHER